MRNDSLDRFGTKLEKRFTKNEIKNMLLNAGFVDIIFMKEKAETLFLKKRRKTSQL